MMQQLSEYDNLIRAIGALQFTSKQMTNTVPQIFTAWKEWVFDNRAMRVREVLSSNETGKVDSRDEDEQYGHEEEDELEDYQEEQYVKIVEDHEDPFQESFGQSNHSYHFLPLDGI